MTNVLDIQTEDNLQYHFYPVSCGSVQFKVRAAKDAHIALTKGPQESDPMIEVFIGGWDNTKSVIRKNRTKPEKVEQETPGILNAGEFRGFWVRWDGGVIQAGYEGKSESFISWEDPEPFQITNVGVCTGWGATGTWKIEEGDEFETPDKLEYKFEPAAAGSLQFEYRGPHNCHVCLSSAAGEVDPMYEIILGGWENTKSAIRYSRQKPDKVTVPTPGIMNPNEFKKFLIQWHCGRLMVRDAGISSGPLIMEWTDPTPFPVAFFGIRSGYGARGQWRVTHFYKTSAKLLENYTKAPGVWVKATGIINKPSSKPVDSKVAKTATLLATFTSAVACDAKLRASPIKAKKILSVRFHWLGIGGGQVPPGALAGGKDASGEPIFVARARHESALLPGKLVSSHGCAYVPWGGKEHGKPEYEVLVGDSRNWVPTSGTSIPPNAFPGGEAENRESLFIGRVNHEGTITTGKVQQSHGVCYISYAGKEIGFPNYEVLVA